MKVLLSLFLMCVSATAAFAQANASVGGTASDASGALVPGVMVTARNVNTGLSTVVVTNETGNYQFASLQPGIYRLTASLPGFGTKTYEKVELSRASRPA